MIDRITLTDGGHARAVVIPALGGWLVEYARNLGSQGWIHAIHHDEAVVARYPKEMWAGSPQLFPLVSYNHLPGADHHYEWEGLRHPLAQHGFARRKAWQVKAQGPAHVAIELVSDAETRAVYPFEFQNELTYRLSEGRLEWDQRVTNTGRSSMPFSAGFHPYFRAPLGNAGRNACYVRCPAGTIYKPVGNAERFDPESAAAQNLPLSRDVSGTLLFGNLAKREFTLVDQGAGIEAVLDWSGAPAYRYCAIWSRSDTEPFYCIEPWTSLPNSFSRRSEDLLLLAPGQTFTAHFTLLLRSLD
jgi:galactose mutarotase-like enzyme